jgi:transcriptional regulator with GAF, ATPase, and Fis domain
MIEKALRENDGVVTRAATQLGVERSNLSQTMKVLGIDRPEDA